MSALTVATRLRNAGTSVGRRKASRPASWLILIGWLVAVYVLVWLRLRRLEL